MKTLVIAGTFDDSTGNPSGYATKLFSKIKHDVFINGGNYEILTAININDFECIFFFANVSNDKPKIINTIKQKNPHCLLITSKNNINNQYKPLDLISRALMSKSNLIIEFTKTNNLIAATVLDPLGNSFIYQETNYEKVALAVTNRLQELKQLTRVSSESIGEAIDSPDEKEFFQIAQQYAILLHDLVHAVNTDRFIGNLSFRCIYGFPSFRNNSLVFVSRRNIDKREIDKNGFVAVSLESNNPIKYYGFKKPSVDTPIQIQLYKLYKNINYMIHTHAYVENAPFTNKIIPCGAIEEVSEIINVIPNLEINFFCINLIGHGSIIASKNIDKLKNIQFLSRNLPEIVL